MTYRNQHYPLILQMVLSEVLGSSLTDLYPICMQEKNGRNLCRFIKKYKNNLIKEEQKHFKLMGQYLPNKQYSLINRQAIQSTITSLVISISRLPEIFGFSSSCEIYFYQSIKSIFSLTCSFLLCSRQFLNMRKVRPILLSTSRRSVPNIR